MSKYFFDRAKEPSTWRGLVMLLTAIGIPIAPDLANAIITAGLALVGVIGVATPDL
tara:strand:- start:440 stop:607 length:168 start_codon:yes stop_codon:yes gene_type:complete